jgi:hypothetical protein
MSMIRVVQYQAEHRRLWDEFVARAKNGVFLFQRDYMEYHADRFTDHSLMFFADERLVALMPANVADNTLVSHGGLTFGGIVSDERMKTPLMLEVFDALCAHLPDAEINKLIYKAVPHIYHDLPAEEDLYALFRHRAQLTRRDVSSTIFQPQRPAMSKDRKWRIRQGQKSGLEIRPSDDYEHFMAIVTQVLWTRHQLKPVHTAAELRLLAGRFPANIKLFGAYQDAQMLAGVVVYESRQVAHAQYISSTEEAREMGAADLLLDYLISDHYAAKRYFDFGISTEESGWHLNTGLINNKEGFGARAVLYDFYELTV